MDEIHRLNRQVEEVLYPAMEDFVIDIVIGKGAAARSIRLDLPKFTLIGATTRAGMLSAPLRDRFGVVSRLAFYTVEELQEIILHSAKILEVEIDKDGALELARRSRGTPRLANRLLKRVRDFAQIKYDGRITKEVADFALNLLEVDKLGLDQTDRQILMTMIQKFGGGPERPTGGLRGMGAYHPAADRRLYRRQPAGDGSHHTAGDRRIYFRKSGGAGTDMQSGGDVPASGRRTVSGGGDNGYPKERGALADHRGGSWHR